jgi:hypothetical protein
MQSFVRSEIPGIFPVVFCGKTMERRKNEKATWQRDRFIVQFLNSR